MPGVGGAIQSWGAGATEAWGAICVVEIHPSEFAQQASAVQAEAPSSVRMSALIDTGSDASYMPSAFAERIGIVNLGLTPMSYTDGRQDMAGVYYVDLHFLGAERIVLKNVRILGQPWERDTSDPYEGIIGCPELSHGTFSYHGRERRWSFTAP